MLEDEAGKKEFGLLYLSEIEEQTAGRVSSGAIVRIGVLVGSGGLAAYTDRYHYYRERQGSPVHGLDPLSFERNFGSNFLRRRDPTTSSTTTTRHHVRFGSSTGAVQAGQPQGQEGLAQECRRYRN